VQVLREKDADITFVEWIRWPTSLPPVEVRDGIRLRRFTDQVPKGSLLTRGLFLRALTKKVREAILEAQPDGIVIQDPELLLAGLGAARRLRVPLFYDSQEHFSGMVAQERPGEARLYDLLERANAGRIEHMFTVSEPIAARFRKLGARVSLVLNSRDAAEILPFLLPRNEAKERLGISPETFVLGFVGSITHESGLESCLAALRGLPPEVRMLVLGGPAAQLDRLREVAAKEGVAERVTFLPPVSAEEAVRIGSAFDVGLLALTGEGPNYAYRAPNKLFEYMALGVPTILSDYQEMRRIAVEDARFALPVPQGNAAAIRESALRLLRDEALRRELGANARRAFDTKYSGERQKDVLRATHPFWR